MRTLGLVADFAALFDGFFAAGRWVARDLGCAAFFFFIAIPLYSKIA
jgi:hypothetical protein